MVRGAKVRKTFKQTLLLQQVSGVTGSHRPVETRPVEQGAGLDEIDEKGRFVRSRPSVKMRSLVSQLRQARYSCLNSTEQEKRMALKCDFCGKMPHYGNVISHANNTRRRRWNPNLKRMRAVVAGVKKHVRVCTACIRAGRVKKAA